MSDLAIALENGDLKCSKCPVPATTNGKHESNNLVFYCATHVPKRQAVFATYSVTEKFKVPKGIDLNAPGVSYFVKWNKLHIDLPNGKSLEVEGAYNVPHEFDWKRPDEYYDNDDSDEDDDETITPTIPTPAESQPESQPSSGESQPVDSQSSVDTTATPDYLTAALEEDRVALREFINANPYPSYATMNERIAPFPEMTAEYSLANHTACEKMYASCFKRQVCREAGKEINARGGFQSMRMCFYIIKMRSPLGEDRSVRGNANIIEQWWNGIGDWRQ
jgi:hypothetical protein